MKTYLLVLAVLLSGCATPAGQSSFWTQQVEVTGYGINLVSPYGILNAGYIQWNRNIEKPKTPDSLTKTLEATKP